MIGFSRWALRVLNWFNWGVGIIAVLAGVIIGFVFPEQFLAVITQDGIESPRAMLNWLRIALPATAPMIILVHIILTRLIAIIDTIPVGTTFSIVNADRLRTIGWALLGTQLLDLIIGLYSMRVSEQTGENMAWGFGLTGWLAVIMLFVLAQIFRDGAAMRAELDGTV